MFISTEEEQIPLPLANGEALVKSSLMGSNLDVNVVQEHEKFQLEEKILNLESEIVSLRHKERSVDEKRREALNKILDIKGGIRVFCRVRPFLQTDKRRTHQPISVESEKIVVRSGGNRKEFGFDKVFPQGAIQEDVFVEVEPILRSALDGHNVCLLSYGQTGTGKTYTMDGSTESPGIIPRVLQGLFQLSSLASSTSITFSISMLEVYLGSVRDLLAPKPSSRTYTRCNLSIQTDSKGSVEIDGLTEMEISNFTKATWLYNKGRRVRSTSWTSVNATSSRSHCLTRISIYRQGDDLGGKAEVSKLWMVDLGGSERLLKTGATGQTLDEGRAINLSLSALGDVIAALRRKRGHVPYRNSKLTQILKDSLGDGSKVLMLVHVSPYEEDVGETTCSFTFAKRARAVECNKDHSEESKKQRERRIAELEEQMKEAEEECMELRNQIRKAEYLLSENKKLFLKNRQPLDDEETVPVTPKEDFAEVTITPKHHEKGVKRNVTSSVPRFMKPTVASRERKTAAEKEIHSRPKSLRSWARSSIHNSGSQSNSFSDARFKALLRTSNKRSRYSETNTTIAEDTKCNGSDVKPYVLPQSKIVASSDPIPRGTLPHHRRRMSDLL